MISVIILTCDSHLKKESCVRHCLASIFNQNYSDFEIILVDNGIEENNIENTYIADLNENHPNISFIKIGNNKTLGRGSARNLGARAAHGEILLFFDEDVILLENDVLTKIRAYHQERLWGCGAQRLWTKEDWFNKNADTILRQIEMCETTELLNNSGEPEQYIRGSADILIEMRSMIGHFGYCNRELFEKIGGFEDLIDSQSFDDDLLNIKLYLSYGLPKLFSEIKIIHINHPIHGSRAHDFNNYSERLTQKGIIEFDSENLIFGKTTSEIITYTDPIKYCVSILDAYEKYTHLLPLNAADMSDNNIFFWKENMQVGLDSFCRIAFLLEKSGNLTKFIDEQSVDFDNLAPVIESLINSNFMTFKGDGSILIKSSRKQNAIKYLTQSGIDNRKFIPNSAFNQFPCDKRSIAKRVDLVMSRYPYCEYLRLGLIGDDDLVGIELQKNPYISTVIIEKDVNILNNYENSDNIQLVELDLFNIDSDIFADKLTTIPKFQTFMTDPPYTLHGGLLFIYSGLKFLQLDGIEREFYLIMNPMIIGKPFQDLLHILYSCNISLKEIVYGFSHYPFPDEYGETQRANMFFKKNNLTNLSHSSTSNLYIFGVVKPDLEILKNSIDLNLVYKHYE